MIQGYGLTETTSLVSVNHPFRLGKGSVGKVLPGREIKLAADGEILVRGGGVTSGYWGGTGSAEVSGDGDGITVILERSMQTAISTSRGARRRCWLLPQA